MKHYRDEYTNYNIIECNNSSELRALLLVLLGDYVDTLDEIYQERLVYMMNYVNREIFSNTIIRVIEAHYDIKVLFKRSDIMLDL